MTPTERPATVVFVDVDDTLVRSFGKKRIPISSVIEQVKGLHRDGAVLYCWSSGGARYAEESAQELGITECFSGFLTKPHVMIDDQPPAEWHRLLVVHPNEAASRNLDDYEDELAGRRA